VQIMSFRRFRLLPAVAAVAVLLMPTAAYGGQTPGGSPVTTGPSDNDGDLSVGVGEGGKDGVSRVRFDAPKSRAGSGVLSPITGWTPPACWLEPVNTPAQMKANREQVWAEGSVGPEWVNGQQDYYVNGHPHKNFEKAKTGKGMWWDGVENPNRKTDPAAISCFLDRDKWVLNGQRPKDGGLAVSPKVLAEAAYDRVRVPNPDPDLSPKAAYQKVNLATWIWVPGAGSKALKPVTVRASLPNLGIWATATATPVGLHIDAGTADADVFPASGDCAIAADGSVGAKYAAGDGNENPPCGVVNRRSSGTGTYPLKATITWKGTWKGSDNTGGTLPEGTFEHDLPVTVKEIQTVNR
jgi:enoyl reductase